MNILQLVLASTLLVSTNGFTCEEEDAPTKELKVTATAYTSHRGQTDSTPFLAAWNNKLKPGEKSIAVSRDLLNTYGLRNGSMVEIVGLEGLYKVRDKMNKRWERKIDIYMGVNKKRALKWGKRNVVIKWKI